MTRAMKSTRGGPAARLGAVEEGELLRHVMETMPSGMYTVDPRGHITSWNRAMEQMTGFTADDVLGEPCSVLSWNTCSGVEVAEGCEPCPLFASGKIDGRRCQIQGADGGRLSVVKRGRAMLDEEGRTVGGIEVVTDLADILALEQQIASLRSVAADRRRVGNMIGRHPVMRSLEERIKLAARSDSAVLITGETGTGKELVAQGIHDLSPRSSGPFVRVSCAALNESLLESELFGHVRGAFTGALSDREGRFEAAHRGTIFLDEIGDVPMATQTRLMRVLQDKQIERVGTNESVRVDIRVVAATNKDLAALCEAGDFRWDLYYRLCVIPLHVPALRDRRSDLPLLVDLFIDRLNRSLGRNVRGVTAEAMKRIGEHNWPGNVRELENAIEYAFVLGSGPLLDVDHLPPTMRPAANRTRTDPEPGRRRGPPDVAEITAALEESGGNRRLAAERFGVSRVTLWKWMRRHGLDYPDSRGAVQKPPSAC